MMYPDSEPVELDHIVYHVVFNHDYDGSTVEYINGIQATYLSEEFCTLIYDKYVDDQNPYKR